MPSSSSSAPAPAVGRSKRKREDFERLFDESSGDDEDPLLPDASDPKEKLAKEFDDYAKNKRLKRSDQIGIMDWWSAADYPHLKTLTSKYLGTPPSSAASERLFSGAGQLYDERRNRLTAEHAEMLLFLMFWLKHPQRQSLLAILKPPTTKE